MGTADKLHELEEEMARTQKNKATEYHIGLLKAKIARLKREIASPKKGGASAGGFDVKKSGDSTVVFIGLPSVGKSTLLNALTNATSKTASYAFTTLDCIPGMMEHRGAKIQLLDLPGIIVGAKEGKGGGKKVLSVARNADLVLIILDVFEPESIHAIKRELDGIGVRLDTRPPQVFITPRIRGGVEVNATVPLTKIDSRIIVGILGEYGIHNAIVILREDVSVDQFIDAVVANRRYASSLTVLNKIDMADRNLLNKLNFEYIPVSAERRLNIEALKDAIYDELNLIRVYTKPRMGVADLKEPMMMRTNSTIADACRKLHRDLLREFKYAQIWGKSAKFPGQKVGPDHVLADGDIITIGKKQG
jgi:small GTP-binding protein